jgi:hypothetical protein
MTADTKYDESSWWTQTVEADRAQETLMKAAKQRQGYLEDLHRAGLNNEGLRAELANLRVEAQRAREAAHASSLEAKTLRGSLTTRVGAQPCLPV